MPSETNRKLLWPRPRGTDGDAMGILFVEYRLHRGHTFPMYLSLLSLIFFLGAPSIDSPTLVTSAGALVKLENIASGQVVVMVVMKGTWCPVCVRELRDLSAMKDLFKRLDARLVGLNAQSSSMNGKARAQLGLAPELYSDPEARFLQGQNLWIPSMGHPMPGLLILNRCGRVHSIWTGRAPGFSARARVLSILQRLKEKPSVCRQLI